MILFQISDLTDEGLESLRVDILETDMPEERGYGYWRGYGGYRRRRAAGFVP